MNSRCNHTDACAFHRANRDVKDCKTQYMIQHYCNNRSNAPLCCHQTLDLQLRERLPWYIAPNGENVTRPAQLQAHAV